MQVGLISSLTSWLVRGDEAEFVPQATMLGAREARGLNVISELATKKENLIVGADQNKEDKKRASGAPLDKKATTGRSDHLDPFQSDKDADKKGIGGNRPRNG
ncbi:hypothetical protein J3459_007776 [Metarhizium acridum]|uniref:uncharacterized protein n=1 Tax=Metarhizium acridum TaxID=92637 RepID=UPI001C6B82C8|nr:hypothetical protein J3458_019128 [Metarhizium acridum]KAG8426836.1 hypothetical protein J3459_007776 [Metarhizium acridum]